MKTVAEYLSPTINKKWYKEFPKSEQICTHSKSEVTVIDLKAEAKRHLEAETTAYQMKQSKSRNSEYTWLKTALSQGTSSDKVAACVVLIQDSPKHNLARLTSLVGQVRAAKQNQCGMLIVALRDLFLSDLLHPKFKLIKFEQQNLDKLDNPSISKNKLLAHWYFEDQLKEIYEKFVVSLSQIASNTVDSNREKAVSIMNDLLMGNSEQEHKLLDFLVNKIGDPSNKVASKVIFCLNKLLYEHSNMKIVVLHEIEKLLFRNNVSPRAQYYAICLLTQFVFDKDDVEAANSLIDVYFAFFKACLKKGEPDSRMMGAILTGVNRAYRFAKIDSEKLNSHIDSLYKVVHVGSFNVSLNALSLLFQVVNKNEKQLNRFYTAFYRKLLDPQIGIANKRAIFLNLLYRVLRSDQSLIRFQAFIKRIFQIILYYPANMACATLYVISQVLNSRTDARKIFTRLKPEIKEENTSQEEEEEDSDSSEEKNENSEDSYIVLSNVITDSSKIVSKSKEVIEIKEESKIKEEFDPDKKYDPFCRNPLGSGAYNSFCYELSVLINHFHPSVALFAKNIMEGKTIDYTGDPLVDMNLIRFLDRYAYKNPKTLECKKETRKGDPFARRAGYVPQGVRSVPVDSESYLNEQADRIPVDELFLYEFLKNRKKTEVKTEDDDDDNESVTSEDFNAMLDGLAKDEDVREFDIAGDITISKNKKKGKTSDDEDEDEEEIASEESDLDEEEDFKDNFENDEDIADFSDVDLQDLDDDFSDMEFDDEGDEVDALRDELSSMKQPDRKFNKKKTKDSDDNVFMSAEKFAEMMEQQGHSKSKSGGSSSMSKVDGADFKQINWETSRNKRSSGPRFGKKGKRPKNFTNSKKSAKKQKR